MRRLPLSVLVVLCTGPVFVTTLATAHTHVVSGARYYWPTSVTTLATGNGKHTHVSVLGVVAYTRVEDDSDVHIRLNSMTMGDTTWIIAECIPRLPCRRPKAGEIVTVKGISRRDPEHNWWEVHPVEQLSP